MPRTSVGTTTTGKDIFVDLYACTRDDVASTFRDFNDIDLFDALMTIEYLILAEKRSENPDPDWRQALGRNRVYIQKHLDAEQTANFKATLNITSAFQARDYGKQRAHPRFKTL